MFDISLILKNMVGNGWTESVYIRQDLPAQPIPTFFRTVNVGKDATLYMITSQYTTNQPSQIVLFGESLGNRISLPIWDSGMYPEPGLTSFGGVEHPFYFKVSNKLDLFYSAQVAGTMRICLSFFRTG